MTTTPSIESLTAMFGAIMMEVRYRLHNPKLDAYETPLRAALSELASLRAENEALKAERDGLREELQATAEEVMPYLNVATPVRGVPAEPTLHSAVKAARLDFKSQLTAERARADALAARANTLMEFIHQQNSGYPGCNICGAEVEGDDSHAEDCGVQAILVQTPAQALAAHDARVRREALEAAAKKCATAYWAMVAPKDHAAMHPTIEFWRDALGLEPMSSAEHEALAAIEPRHPEIVMVDELAALVRLLVHSIRKHSPDNETARRAMDYLKRHELQGSPLRTTILSPAPDAAKVQPSASRPPQGGEGGEK